MKNCTNSQCRNKQGSLIFCQGKEKKKYKLSSQIVKQDVSLSLDSIIGISTISKKNNTVGRALILQVVDPVWVTQHHQKLA